MSETLRRVQALVLAGDHRVSDHAYEELRKDAILISEVIAGITTADLVEEYRARERVLALQYGANGRPIHAVWALSERRQAVLVTAYRPDPAVWDSEFKERRKR
jgi:uncharacterized protein DUF4258